MTILKQMLAAAGVMFAMSAASSATASPILYNVSGTYTDGSQLTGSFDFDGSQTGAAQFSNINVCTTGQFCWNHVFYGPFTSNNTEYVGFNGRNDNYSGDYIYLAFPITTTGGTTAISGTQLSNGTYTYYYYSSRNLRSGTIVAAAPVPEPAAWAMMILGMGAVGYAMRRRRKIATRVSYAA